MAAIGPNTVVLRDLDAMPGLRALVGGALGGPGGDPKIAVARGVAAELWDEVLAALRPAAAYREFAVRGVEPEAVVLDTGDRLHSAAAAKVFGRGTSVVLLAYTVGPLLEARVSEYRREGAAKRAIVLDLTASLAVDAIGQLAHYHVKKLAAGRGVKASIPLNPGTSHWPIEDLALFARLIPGDAIGLAVHADKLFRPVKSIAMAIALGGEVPTDAEDSSCHYCRHTDLCHQPRTRLIAALDDAGA